ncbi:DUF4150 domain-containing protein [Geomesophilobacter sediminis]|uniref:DUF4150 domain-containing protein n=1 Tax=Geomesophilobacter sediminis TaxID=2798584 RepID=A0A8J7M1W3_9BACT|nr:DUF4150 domain-containing protein [Geomesophilobacter sediminis]MBJ6727003.1 DUF4150 domain-containing protein [Geomesophilobacter sediminis]
MATTTQVNGQTVVHKTSEGVLITVPDTCLTPVGPTLVPIPYTNVARSEDTQNGSQTVLVDGNPIMLKDSCFSKSSGGIGPGVLSGTSNGRATFQNYSFDVKVEGRNVCRRLDVMTSNNGNTPPGRLTQPNCAGGTPEAAAGKYQLTIAFEYRHPDVRSGRRHQPVFQVAHTVKGPETHQKTELGYVGTVHHCDTPGGKYGLGFERGDKPEEQPD